VFGCAVTVGGTIAMGILRTPAQVAAHLPTPWLYLGAWVAGGLFSLAGAASVAELAAMWPRSGGPFRLTRRALGPGLGCVAGGGDWPTWCATAAAMALVRGESLAHLVPPLAGRERFLALAILSGVALVQWRDLRVGSFLQKWTSLLKAVGFLALIACCFAFAGSPAEVPAEPRPVPAGLAFVAAAAIAVQGVMFTYSGWAITSYFGEEVADAGRAVPRSMILGTLVIVGIYLLFNLALLSVLSLPELAGARLSAGAAAGKVFGAAGETVVGALAVVSLL